MQRDLGPGLLINYSPFLALRFLSKFLGLPIVTDYYATMALNMKDIEPDKDICLLPSLD